MPILVIRNIAMHRIHLKNDDQKVSSDNTNQVESVEIDKHEKPC